MDQIFIKELELQMSIGIYDAEKAAPQRVIVSAYLDIETSGAQSDEIADTVSYETVANTIKDLATTRHFNLVESFAEEIASECLKDKRVMSIELEIEKPDIFNDAKSVGIKIIRKN